VESDLHWTIAADLLEASHLPADSMEALQR
jgi:hypothetical protein